MMRAAVLALLAALAPARASAADLTFVWDPPSTGPVPQGYYLHLGTASKIYTNTIHVGDVRRFTVTGLADGRYYAVASAYNSVGGSPFSNEVTALITAGAIDTNTLTTARVLTVTPDATGATVTLEPTGQVLEYQDDTTAHGWVALPDYPRGSQSYRHVRSWTTAHTFVCYRTHGTDEQWTEQQCNTLVGVVVPPPPPPPAAPVPPPPPPPPAAGLRIDSTSPDQVIITAPVADCPRVVTSTKGSTSTTHKRTITCVR